MRCGDVTGAGKSRSKVSFVWRRRGELCLCVGAWILQAKLGLMDVEKPRSPIWQPMRRWRGHRRTNEESLGLDQQVATSPLQVVVALSI